MPVSGTQEFIFAIFLASSTTVSTTGITPTYTDAIWQNLGGYNTNNTSISGRINARLALDVGAPTGYGPGSTVDFIIRGWSANAGGSWAEALNSWNNGSPLTPMFIGSSTIGNNIILSDVATATVFGPLLYQVPGFNMTFVPEPSALTFAGLGAAAMWLVRRRSR